MEQQKTFANKTAALCAAAAVTMAVGAGAAFALPTHAEAATLALQAQAAQGGSAQATTKTFSKGMKNVAAKNATAATVKTTADKSKRVTTVQVKLNGAQAKTYNVWYRVNVKGYGWMGWAKNNAKAGSLAKGAYVTQIQTALIKKSAKKQENTDRKAYSPKNGFMTKITGIESTDAAIKKIAKKNGMSLKKCYKWAHKLGYASSGVNVKERKTMSKKHQSQIAKFAFKHKRGDCYGTNVAFAKLAHYLGYSTNVYLGSIVKNGKAVNPEYGWTVIKTNGKWNIYDAYQGKYYNVSQKSKTGKLYKRH